MKRIILYAACALCGIVCASCDSKLCYCYENEHEEELYVSTDAKSSAYGNARRGCVESNERMDPRQIASEQKKAKAQ